MVRIIALIMLAVAALDTALAAWFFPNLLAGLACVALLGLGAGLARRWWGRPRGTEVAGGWRLGQALELTDPGRPSTQPDAVLSAKTLNLGVLAIGAPGAGKTESVLLGYIDTLTHEFPRCGWAVFEGKGDIDIYKKCVAMGAKPDFFFSSELPGSDSINLMQGEAHDVLDRLCKVLIGHTASTSYYSDEQRAVLARIVPLLLALRLPVNLRDLYAVLTMEAAGADLVRRARAAGVDSVELQLAQQWLEQPQAIRVKNVAGLLNRLFVFVNGPYADRLNCYQADIDIARAVPAGQSIYFHLPLTQFARDVAIAIIEAFGVEARKRQLGGTENLDAYPLLFDDWGAFFHEGFGPFSARCRSAAMPLSFGFQSRAQLEAVGPTFADELDDTIATKIVMRVQGTATASYAARLLGEYETQEVSTSAMGGREGSSLGYTRRSRIDPRDLRELQEGEAYISTLARENGKTINPLWKVRLPLPDFADWRGVSMPAAKTHAEGEGLGLWRRYMDPAALTRIHAEVTRTMAESDTQRAAQGQASAQQERARILSNPGLVIEGGAP